MSVMKADPETPVVCVCVRVTFSPYEYILMVFGRGVLVV